MQQYGSPPDKEEILEAGNSCPICQEELKDPIMLRACKVLKDSLSIVCSHLLCPLTICAIGSTCDQFV